VVRKRYRASGNFTKGWAGSADGLGLHQATQAAALVHGRSSWCVPGGRGKCEAKACFWWRSLCEFHLCLPLSRSVRHPIEPAGETRRPNPGHTFPPKCPVCQRARSAEPCPGLCADTFLSGVATSRSATRSREFGLLCPGGMGMEKLHHMRTVVLTGNSRATRSNWGWDRCRCPSRRRDCEGLYRGAK